ncbi:MAG: DUF4349 domain-containing protein [Marmoricola sp.]
MKPTRIALAVPAVLLLAACGTNHVDSSVKSARSATGSHPAAAKPVPNAQPAPADGLSFDTAQPAGTGELSSLDKAATGSAAGGGSTAQAASAPDVESAAVINKGQISLQAAQIDDARFELVKILDTYDGMISAENSSGDDHGRTERDRLELGVPSKNFTDAMDAIAKLKFGTLLERTSSSNDVTTQVIDVNTRVRTQKLSLARVQALLDRATSIDEIIRIEGQVARRQADLDSLEQQQKYLADQTTLSTITVYLTVPPKKKQAAAHHHHGHHTFLTGFGSGWRSLGSITSAALTGIGAVLPFAAVLLVVGAPIWFSRRRRLG